MTAQPELLTENGTSSPARFKIRSPCYHNLSSLPVMAEGELLPDLIAAVGKRNRLQPSSAARRRSPLLRQSSVEGASSPEPSVWADPRGDGVAREARPNHLSMLSAT